VWWLGLFALVVALALVATFAPVRLALSVQGKGDPSGAWALAGGAKLGPFTATAVAALGVPAVMELRLFRWRLWRKRLAELREGPEREREAATVGERYRHLERWVDPDALAGFLLGEHKRAHLEHLEIELDYSFADVTTTGMLFGSLAALDGMLPARVVLRQVPRWEARDSAAGSIDARVKLWPGLLGCDALAFAWRHLKLRRRTAPETS
jgi:hypothetical protein